MVGATAGLLRSEHPHEWVQWVCGVEGKQNYNAVSGEAESSKFMVQPGEVLASRVGSTDILSW